MVVAFYFRLHLAYFPRPVVAIFARPEHPLVQTGEQLLKIGIGYFDYKNRISPAKSDGGFSYIIKANKEGIIHI